MRKPPEAIAKNWMTLDEAQRELGWGRTKLWELRQDGTLREMPWGRMTLVHRRDVNDLLKQYA